MILGWSSVQTGEGYTCASLQPNHLSSCMVTLEVPTHQLTSVKTFLVPTVWICPCSPEKPPQEAKTKDCQGRKPDQVLQERLLDWKIRIPLVLQAPWTHQLGMTQKMEPPWGEDPLQGTLATSWRPGGPRPIPSWRVCVYWEEAEMAEGLQPGGIFGPAGFFLVRPRRFGVGQRGFTTLPPPTLHQ